MKHGVAPHSHANLPRRISEDCSIYSRIFLTCSRRWPLFSLKSSALLRADRLPRCCPCVASYTEFKGTEVENQFLLRYWKPFLVSMCFGLCATCPSCSSCMLAVPLDFSRSPSVASTASSFHSLYLSCLTGRIDTAVIARVLE